MRELAFTVDETHELLLREGIELSAESVELLDYLVAHMLQPRYIYQHSWSVNDAMLWDNRRFMHAGLGNKPDDPRWGLRTTLAGPVRTGRYFEAGAKASNAPTMVD